METFLTNFLKETSIVSVTDKTGTIIAVNDNFCKISGYSREELVGSSHNLIKSGHHDQVFYRDMWKTIKSGKIWRGDICNRSKNGDLYWVDSFIKPELGEGNSPVKYYSYRVVITEEKEAQERVLQQNKKLKEIARIQAHELRGPVSSILGLANLLLEYKDIDDKEIVELIEAINDTTRNLDKVIHKIVAHTLEEKM
ncbi:MAG: PAS domain S-box protein [Niabella sp.]